MESLRNALTRGRPTIQTRKALLLLDFQKEFTDPDGKFPAILPPGIREQIPRLVTSFRGSQADIIWVRTAYAGPQAVGNTYDGSGVDGDDSDQDIDDGEASETDAIEGEAEIPANEHGEVTKNDVSMPNIEKLPEPQTQPSEDLFLSGLDGLAHCVGGSHGIEFSEFAVTAIDDKSDVQLWKESYSAFANPNLLMTLRSRMVTEIYICGTLTNVAVFATAADAGQYGLSVYVVRDCLGYRNRELHNRALAFMEKKMGVEFVETNDTCGQHSVDGAPLSNSHYKHGANVNHTASKGVSAFSHIRKSIRKKLRDDSKSLDDLSVREPKIRKVSKDQRSQSKLPVREKPSVEQIGSVPSTAANTPKVSKTRKDVSHPLLFGPQDKIGEGDSYIQYDAFRGDAANDFHSLKTEIDWQTMYHATGLVPRLVCVQGSSDPIASTPVYRHPADNSLPMLKFSPLVKEIRDKVERIVGHPMNHVLIQLYRGGDDYISEHSDKSLDIVRGSRIVNVSFGAQRTMRLRTKRSARETDLTQTNRQLQLIPMPHGSVFALGPATNMKWLHGINRDRRPIVEKSQAELAYSGERISLTFRNIGTFIDHTETHIWGQGATSKVWNSAKEVMNANLEKSQQLINAFGFENQKTEFDWDSVYGQGFDVLHFKQAPQLKHLIFLSGDYSTDLRVKTALEFLRIDYDIAGVHHQEAGKDYKPQMCFRDLGPHKTQVLGEMDILAYLWQYFAVEGNADDVATVREYADENIYSGTSDQENWLQRLEDTLTNHEHAVGDSFTFADCILWPSVDELIDTYAEWDELRYPRIDEYHRQMQKRGDVHKAIWVDAGM